MSNGFREEDFFFNFSHYKSMGVNDLQDVASVDPSEAGAWSIWTQGHGWQDLKGNFSIKIAKIVQIKK